MRIRKDPDRVPGLEIRVNLVIVSLQILIRGCCCMTVRNG
jgi:hypothetical protein